MGNFAPCKSEKSFGNLHPRTRLSVGTPPCEELWLPQPRAAIVSGVQGTSPPTQRASSMRVFGNVSSLWDQRIAAFPQSHWAYYNYPFDKQVTTYYLLLTTDY